MQSSAIGLGSSAVIPVVPRSAAKRKRRVGGQGAPCRDSVPPQRRQRRTPAEQDAIQVGQEESLALWDFLSDGDSSDDGTTQHEGRQRGITELVERARRELSVCEVDAESSSSSEAEESPEEADEPDSPMMRKPCDEQLRQCNPAAQVKSILQHCWRVQQARRELLRDSKAAAEAAPGGGGTAELEEDGRGEWPCNEHKRLQRDMASPVCPAVL